MDSEVKNKKAARKGFAAGTLFGALTVTLLLGGAFSSLGNAPRTAIGAEKDRSAATANASTEMVQPGEANADRDVLALQLD